MLPRPSSQVEKIKIDKGAELEPGPQHVPDHGSAQRQWHKTCIVALR